MTTHFAYSIMRVDYPVDADVRIENLIETSGLFDGPVTCDHLILVSPTVEPATWVLRCSCGQSAVVHRDVIDDVCEQHWQAVAIGIGDPAGPVGLVCSCITSGAGFRMPDPWCPTHKGN